MHRIPGLTGFKNLSANAVRPLPFQGFVLRCGGGGKPTPSLLERLRIMTETSNLARKYTHICSFRKYTFQYQGPFNFADVSIFCKKLALLGQNNTFTQSNGVRVVLEMVRQKVTINENISFTDYASGMRLPDCFKLTVNWKTDNDVTIF